MTRDGFDTSGIIFTNLASQALQISIQDLVDQRAFSGPGNTRDTAENTERDVDVEVLQIVLPGATNLNRASGLGGCFGVL